MKNSKFIKILTLEVIWALAVYSPAFACETGYVKGVNTGDCIKASDSCGSSCVYTIDEKGLLTVSGNGSIKADAFKGNLDIVSAKINDGITGFGQYSFANTSNMTSIDIANSATSYAYFVFQGSSIQSLELPSTVKSVDLSIIAYSPNIKELILPQGLSELRGGCHVGSSGIKDLVVPETVTKFNDPISPGSSTIYCTQAQISSGLCNSSALRYERDENNNFVVYNSDNTIKGIYSDYASITNDIVIDSYSKKDAKGNIIEEYDGRGNRIGYYTYDGAGNLTAVYKNGVATYKRTSYTPTEAAKAANKGHDNKITFTFK